MDTFLISILFSVVISFWHIQSSPIIRFNIYFVLIHDTQDIEVKHEIHLPNNLNQLHSFFHLKVHLLVYAIYQFQLLACMPRL